MKALALISLLIGLQANAGIIEDKRDEVIAIVTSDSIQTKADVDRSIDQATASVLGTIQSYYWFIPADSAKRVYEFTSGRSVSTSQAKKKLVSYLKNGFASNVKAQVVKKSVSESKVFLKKYVEDVFRRL